ncbi:Activity-regulated cytoskeleton associated protein 2 [Frankliniella fusca]|uniref:Activity-regulated cytoskeleton associated protein 2 n=1 Tax=Frankliniella fusca TaxID=407009 RepID=A0AAE1LTL1_9NEOP|nr:Activity-regulated cytoskeleton associated protein 2 [Frankliniella fusca]
MDVEEKAESCGIDPRHLLKGAPEFFCGRAKTWYRSVKGQIESWKELNFLRTEFLPVGYSDNLWEEVRARLQGASEPIGTYIANMLSLFDRLALMGPIKEDIKLNIFVKNLAPFYVGRLANTPILSIPHLKQLGRNLEMTKFRIERYDKSRKTPLIEPEFAFMGRSRKTPLDALSDTEPNKWRQYGPFSLAGAVKPLDMVSGSARPKGSVVNFAGAAEEKIQSFRIVRPARRGRLVGTPTG